MPTSSRISSNMDPRSVLSSRIPAGASHTYLPAAGLGCFMVMTFTLFSRNVFAHSVRQHTTCCGEPNTFLATYRSIATNGCAHTTLCEHEQESTRMRATSLGLDTRKVQPHMPRNVPVRPDENVISFPSETTSNLPNMWVLGASAVIVIAIAVADALYLASIV